MTTGLQTRRSLLPAALAALAVCGCASRGNVDLLEGRLRQQEDQLYALRRQLTSAQTELAASQREAAALRTRAAPHSTASPAPEQIASLARVEGVQISRLMSGGLDRDGQPGDDVLKALVVPVDAQGDLVKAPGAVRLELLDLSRNGPQQQIGVWEFSVEQAERQWKKGLFGSGYAFELNWQQPPQSSTVTVHARLTTADGRQFDTSQEVRIAPPAVTTATPATPAHQPARPPELLTPVGTSPRTEAQPARSAAAPPFPASPTSTPKSDGAGLRPISVSPTPAAEDDPPGVVRLASPYEEREAPKRARSRSTAAAPAAAGKLPGAILPAGFDSPESDAATSAEIAPDPLGNPFEQSARRVPPPAARPRTSEATSDRWTETSRPTLR